MGALHMTWENPSNEQIKEILKNANTIAVVGLSDNPERTSYQIAKEMQRAGYKIIPVNPMIDEVLGEKAYASLEDIEEQVDIVNVFRRSEFLPEIAKSTVNIKAPVFWAQQGVVNQEAYDYLKDKDVTVIMDLCIKVLHSLLVK